MKYAQKFAKSESLMPRQSLPLVGVLVLLAALLGSPVLAEESGKQESADDASRFWTQWRGPLATGEAPHANPPTEWSETKNIRWKTAIPGSGHSTPVLWKSRLFLTTAIPYGEAVEPKPDEAPGAHDNSPVTHHHKFVVVAIDRKGGKILWQKTVREVLPKEGGHYTGSLASNSPATDGKLVYAFFGSRGLYALDFEGNVEWKQDLGRMQTKHAHGEGSSPALWEDTIVVNWDHEFQSFIAAFDTETGKRRWRVARDEVTSWASPIIVRVDGKPQIIVSGTTRVRGYALEDGAVIWECAGLSKNVVASPVYADGIVYAGSSYDHRALFAIHIAGAKGDLTRSDRVLWRRQQRTPYVPSPLLYRGSVYFLRHYQGILSRIEGASGREKLGPFRLRSIRDVYASPVAAAGRVYVTDRKGMTVILSHDNEPRILAENRLDESINASAVLVDRELFLRGDKHLYCIAEPAK